MQSKVLFGLFIIVLASVRQSTQLHLINGLLILEEEEVDDQLQPITKSANRKSIVREKQITNIDSSGSSNDDDVDNVPVFGSVSNYLAGAANRPGDHNWTENFIKDFKVVQVVEVEDDDDDESDEKDNKDDSEESKERESTTRKPSGNRVKEVNSVTSPTMDVITIIWYFSTFVALIAFFVVMACSDNYCGREAEKPEETAVTAPPTPAPSYREFAPPSYESVMKKYKNRVFIIPMLNENGELKPFDEPQAGGSSSPSSSSAPSSSTSVPTVTVVEVMEEVVVNETRQHSNDIESARF